MKIEKPSEFNEKIYPLGFRIIRSSGFSNSGHIIWNTNIGMPFREQDRIECFVKENKIHSFSWLFHNVTEYSMLQQSVLKNGWKIVEETEKKSSLETKYEDSMGNSIKMSENNNIVKDGDYHHFYLFSYSKKQ